MVFTPEPEDCESASRCSTVAASLVFGDAVPGLPGSVEDLISVRRLLLRWSDGRLQYAFRSPFANGPRSR
jgi:hypothetical protein